MTPVGNSVEPPAPPAVPDADAAPRTLAGLQPLLDRLCDRTRDIVFFPVRHHSPQCAMMVERLLAEMRPAAVLIEGPSDYNEHLAELTLDHRLPIAIYSYFRTPDGKSSGAFYPFCEYSPEWVAATFAARAGIPFRFIDLPWSVLAATEPTTHRYADAELRRGRYVRHLCERMEVENFDDLWDKLIEAHERISLDDYLLRVHSLCLHIRLWEEETKVSDSRREAFMEESVRRVRSETEGRILVVTGGYHSSALAARLTGLPCPCPVSAVPKPYPAPEPPPIQGIALTSYSYERLDNLTGYDAGMPNPGFYHHTWRQRRGGEPFSHRPLLADLVVELRERKQTFSTADLIAVETAARGLAALRGRGHVWRRDLVDGVISALIKDELEYGCASPFVEAVHAILRGRHRGRLAEGTRLPPLVEDIRDRLAQAEMDPQRAVREVELDLLVPADLEKSRLLHRLRVLQIAGFERIGGTDFLMREDLTRLWEVWRLRWSPDFDSSCIEASRYGVATGDATASKLQETVRERPRSAAAAAAILVQAAQAGIDTLSANLLADLQGLLQQESDFVAATQALGHVFFLHSFDEAFGTTRHRSLVPLLRLAFERSLWLLELIGRSLPNLKDALDGMKTLLDAFLRTSETVEIGPAELVAVMKRVEHDAHKPPAVRGAAAGILWTLDAADVDRIVADLLLFTEPSDLGDFLAGLFAAAREVAQRHPTLVRAIDRLLLEFPSEAFQEALPSLRMAFTYFTPREKHHMLGTLFQALGIKQVQQPGIVDEATAVEALALDERVFEALRVHGLDEMGDSE